MNRLQNTKFLVLASLLASLTTISTMILKIPTPTLGYVHPGDGLVLLCGFLLGPIPGALAAGIGSGLSDLLSGYAVWVPGTVVIKGLTAWTAGALCLRLKGRFGAGSAGRQELIIPALSGILGETVMVLGYFLYNVLMVSLVSGSLSSAALGAAMAQSLEEIPFNIAQAVLGVLLSLLLLPVLKKVMSDVLH